MENKKDIPNVHLVNKDGSKFKSIQEEFYGPGTIPACNPDNTCEKIQDFLGEETPIHYSLWYYEFKEQKTKRILEIEKKLFELKDEHFDLIQELHNIQDDLLVRLNKTLN
jgi:hypothetical protein